jgi:hypothetical protein
LKEKQKSTAGSGLFMMNANASASFFTNLRGSAKMNASSSMRSSRTAIASNDKENAQNSNIDPAAQQQPIKMVSKLRRPKTASAILQSKSSGKSISLHCFGAATAYQSYSLLQKKTKNGNGCQNHHL